MDGPLREGDGEAFRLQPLLSLLGQVPAFVPEGVFRLRPGLESVVTGPALSYRIPPLSDGTHTELKALARPAKLVEGAILERVGFEAGFRLQRLPKCLQEERESLRFQILGFFAKNFIVAKRCVSALWPKQ